MKEHRRWSCGLVDSACVGNECLNPARNISYSNSFIHFLSPLYYHFHKNGKKAIKIMKIVKGLRRRYESILEGWILTGNENEQGDYLADEGSGGTGEWQARRRERHAFGQAGANALCVCVCV